MKGMKVTTPPPTMKMTMTHDATVLGLPVRDGVEIAILARRAELGKGKTRLAEGMGAESALEVYHRLIRLCAASVRGSGLPATVFFDPAPGDLSVWAPAAFGYGIQNPDPDLGERMRTAALAVLAHRRGVLIIGTDCPYLTPAHLELAATKLDEVDVVIGPSLDGGYYLLGLKVCPSELFEGIAWSTDRVADQTRQVLAKAGLSSYELPTLGDIDVEADWLTYLSTVHNS